MKNKRITLRIPKNPRKYNIWESDQLNSTMEKCAQLLSNFNKVAEETGTYPSDIDTLSIPAHLVYEICESYVVMYEKLLKEQLLITGNPVANLNIH